MRPNGDDRFGRRTFMIGSALAAAAAGLDLGPAGAAEPPPAGKVDPPLAPKPAVVDRLTALKPNHAVLLGRADVAGEFNATAKKFDLDETGPRSRDFTLKMGWAADRK